MHKSLMMQVPNAGYYELASESGTVRNAGDAVILLISSLTQKHEYTQNINRILALGDAMAALGRRNNACRLSGSDSDARCSLSSFGT